MMDAIISQLEAKARESARFNEGDYIKDGLLHCGNCHTPKQKVITKPWNGEVLTVFHDCDCEHAKYMAERAAFEEQQEARRRENRKAEAIKSDSYRKMTFSNADTNKGNQKYLLMASSYIAKWPEVKKNNTSLIFSGGIGVGKTFVAGCIANELHDMGVDVYMETIGEMLNLASNFETVNELMEKVVRCDLLVIDDFGANRETDFAIEKIFEIIDKRIRSGKPFIVTTNLSKADFHSPAGIKQHRIYSRLLEGTAIVEFKGVDIRLENGKSQAQQFLDEILAGPEQQGMF